MDQNHLIAGLERQLNDLAVDVRYVIDPTGDHFVVKVDHQLFDDVQAQFPAYKGYEIKYKPVIDKSMNQR